MRRKRPPRAGAITDDPPPWHAEIELTPERAAALISARFPDLATVGLVRLAEGWDNTAFLTADDVVFRFPRRPAAAALLRTEARVLPQLAGRLPLAVPHPLWVGEPAHDFPWPFLGHVHGDLYARHLLTDDEASPTGVIDWGDVHAGDPAVDLMVAFEFLPAGARAAFFEAYGEADADVLRTARLRATFHAISVTWYGVEQADAALVREGRASLEFVLED